MRSEVTESSAPVGSSASNSLGSLASALATATRWRSPPDNCAGTCSARSASPTSSSSSSARRRRSPRRIPAPSSGTSTFVCADSVSSNRCLWNTNPTTSRRAFASCGSRQIARPPTSTRPVSGWAKPPIRASSVLLPEPLRPVMTTAWPGSTCSEASRSALIRPKLFETRSTSTSAPARSVCRTELTTLVQARVRVRRRRRSRPRC
jgi:hypothetical protein